MHHRISVVIPFYSADATLREALASVRAQTRAPDEILVVDDASPPERARSLEGLDPDIRLVRQPANGGVGATRRAATPHVTGDLIAYLDADDAWAPEKLARQEAFLDANPHLAACHTGTVVWRGGSDFGPRYLNKPPLLTPHNVLLGGHGLASALMIRRDALLAAGDWDDNRYVLEDWDLAIRLVTTVGPIGFLPEPLTLFRRAGHGNVTSDPWFDLIIHLAAVHRHKAAIIATHGKHAVNFVHGRFLHRMGGILGGVSGRAIRLAGRCLMHGNAPTIPGRRYSVTDPSPSGGPSKMPATRNTFP